MAICKASVLTIFLIYFVLSKALFFVSVRYLSSDLQKAFIAMAIFDIVYIFDIVLLLSLFNGVCEA